METSQNQYLVSIRTGTKLLDYLRMWGMNVCEHIVQEIKKRTGDDDVDNLLLVQVNTLGLKPLQERRLQQAKDDLLKAYSEGKTVDDIIREKKEDSARLYELHTRE